MLQSSPVKQQIVWLDCCYSGELFNISEANPGEEGDVRDRCFIAACREFEPAYSDKDSSMLTGKLLAALDPNRCAEPWVTNFSLLHYLDRQFQDPNQRPVSSNFGQPINLTRITRQEVIATPSTPLSEANNTICPYKGLAYFDCNEEDAKYFFGREELTDRLIDKVRQSNFLALVGVSGSGKSSVLRAGLLHQLKLGRRLGGSHDWEIKIMVPGERPLENLALAFVDSNLQGLDRAEQLGKAEGLLKEGADGLRRLIQSSHSPKIVLAIDQFEETFTLCEDLSAREKFIQTAIVGVLDKTTEQFCLLLAMRADFFGKCVEREYSGLGETIQQHLVTVTPMNRQQLRKAIVEPAKQVQLAVEPELVEQILEDVESAPGSLPLLQDALLELWKGRKDNSLQLTTYMQLGKIAGTLDRRATEVYGKLDKEEQAAAKHIFLCLTRLGEGTEDTRRRLPQQNLLAGKYGATAIEKVVKKLADEKLVVTGEIREKGNKRVAVVEVIHEALIRHWLLLRQWLDESRKCLLQKEKIETAAREWESRQRDKGDYLLRGKRLKEARVFAKEQRERFPLSKKAELFIGASVRRSRLSLVGMTGLLIVPVIIIVGIVEPRLRKQAIDRNLQALRSGVGGKIEVEYLVEGCDVKNRERIPEQWANLWFGNCVDLDNQEFENAKLSGAKLWGANLRGADLRGADLRGADLRGADLWGADLWGADLWGADLGGADLGGADLRGANLGRADLWGADLGGANLGGADLGRADLWRANLGGANLGGADLGGADLRGANLGGADLWGDYLWGAYLRGDYLWKTNLRGGNLWGAYLRGDYLWKTNLRGGNLRGAYLRGVDLENIRWDEETNWSDVEGLERAKNVPEALRKQLGLHRPPATDQQD